MAIGIADYAEHHGMVSQKQAEWLARNADFHNQPRPTELCAMSLSRKERGKPLERQSSLFEQQDNQDNGADDLVLSLTSVRHDLDAVISRLRSRGIS